MLEGALRCLGVAQFRGGGWLKEVSRGPSGLIRNLHHVTIMGKSALVLGCQISSSGLCACNGVGACFRNFSIPSPKNLVELADNHLQRVVTFYTLQDGLVAASLVGASISRVGTWDPLGSPRSRSASRREEYKKADAWHNLQILSPCCVSRLGRRLLNRSLKAAFPVHVWPPRKLGRGKSCVSKMRRVDLTCSHIHFFGAQCNPHTHMCCLINPDTRTIRKTFM